MGKCQLWGEAIAVMCFEFLTNLLTELTLHACNQIADSLFFFSVHACNMFTHLKLRQQVAGLNDNFNVPFEFGKPYLEVKCIHPREYAYHSKAAL